MSERRYYGTGRKKYTSRHERVKEVPRCRHNNHDYIVPDEVLPGQDDDICEANDICEIIVRCLIIVVIISSTSIVLLLLRTIMYYNIWYNSS